MSPKKDDGFKFKFGKPTARKDIPPKSPNSVIAELPLWAEVDAVLAYTEAHGVAPFEEALEYNVKDYPELKKLKQPRQSILQSLRARLKKHKLDNKLEIQNRGDRIFLVGV